MARLEPGDVAPPFDLINQDERRVRLEDFSSKRLLLYFYPKDDTPGCTTEARQFQDLAGDFKRAGVVVVGVSPDGPESHRRFRERHGLRFDLLSDPGHEVAEAYGAWGEKVRYGKTSLGIIRSTFLIGPDARVAARWYNVRAEGHAARVLAEIG